MALKDLKGYNKYIKIILYYGNFIHIQNFEEFCEKDSYTINAIQVNRGEWVIC